MSIEKVLFNHWMACLKFIVDDDGTYGIRIYSEGDEMNGMQIWCTKQQALELVENMRKLIDDNTPLRLIDS
jgi:hypothetical protein